MGKRVLLADDSATIQKLVKMALSGTTYELFSAFDGREALNLLSEAAPDIVLADAIMPDMDGYDLCKAVKDLPEYRGVPVVLLIGRFQPYDENRAQAAGIDERMIKPFSSDRLIELIEKLLAQSVSAPMIESESGLDETVNMSAEELAAHTSHWQADQTAMTEDIPKIEDIDFDEDVHFDESQVTSDLSDADTMMLEEDLQDPGSGFENQADFGGPMTMELATEDLTDIEDPVDHLEPLSTYANDDDVLVDDDLEELDESDLLDDSVADLDATVAYNPDSSFPSPTAIEDLDTGPLTPLEDEVAPQAVVADDDEGDTQPVALRDDPPEQSTASLDQPLLDGGTASLTFDKVDPEKVLFEQAENTTAADPEPETAEEELPAPTTEFEMPSASTDADLSFTDPVESESEIEVETSDFDLPVATQSFEQTDLKPDADLSFATAEVPVDVTPAEPEVPLEVDEESPLEETALDHDAILEDVDFEPMGNDVDEPLAEALLAEVPASFEAEVADPQESDLIHSEVTVSETTEFELVSEVETEAEDDFEAAAEVTDAVTDVTEVTDAVEVDQSAFLPQEPMTVDDDDDVLVAGVESLDEPTPFHIDTVEQVSLNSHQSEPEPESVIDDATGSTDLEPEVEETQLPVAEAVAGLSEDQLNLLADKVAERVMRKFERETLREIAWEVIPELSEAIIKKRIYELEQAVDQD